MNILTTKHSGKTKNEEVKMAEQEKKVGMRIKGKGSLATQENR